MDSMRKFFSYMFHDLSQHQILTGNSSQHNQTYSLESCTFEAAHNLAMAICCVFN